MRMRKKPWAEAEITDNRFVVSNARTHKGQWSSLFQNTNPIHVEIGMGKGGFIIEKAYRFPHINFIGIERQLSVFAVASKKIRERGDIENVRVAMEDGGLLTEIFAENEINQIYINFCDPWPKKRYAKRRLTHRGYLAQYAKVLTKEGKLNFKTDNKELYKFSLDELAGNNWQIESVTVNPSDGNILTEYEKKFIEQGMDIFSIVASVGG